MSKQYLSHFGGTVLIVNFKTGSPGKCLTAALTCVALLLILSALVISKSIPMRERRITLITFKPFKGVLVFKACL